MNFKKIISLLFRKYSSFRFFSLAAVVVLALVILSFATVQAKRSPVISDVIPAVGSPGDTMIIRGNNFGDSRGTSYVEIGGSRITASSYLTWTNGMIKLILPSNVQDGLIIVKTASGQSKPGFFANEIGIPVKVSAESRTTQPVVSSILPASGGYGTLITITGANFGSVRGSSSVLFSAARDDASQTQKVNGNSSGELNLQFIPANPDDFDYEYWSDSEIRVRIPDGSTSGPVIISTEKGESNAYGMEITVSPEVKNYVSRKSYLIQVNSDVENINSRNSTNITLRIPRPVLTAGQPLADLTECIPEPVLEDFKNTVVYRFELARNSSPGRKTRYQQNYIVSTYSILSNLNEKLVKPYAETERQLYKAFTQSDQIIQSDNEEVTVLAKKITGKEKNPLTKARLLYTYIISNYKISDELRKSDLSPLDLLKSSKGDAYDIAVFYTTLLRASGIPAATSAGILVDADLKAKSHWWTEFHLENYGWIPVDAALAMGLSYKSFKFIDNPAEFYFGNQDGQHITFTRGWNELRQTISENSKIVYRPKSYALQSIWEESSEGDVNYSSLWNDPVVLGIY